MYKVISLLICDFISIGNPPLSKYQENQNIQNDNIDELHDTEVDDLDGNLIKLGPLIVAYDEELCEKDEIIAEYETQLYNLKIQ